MVSNFLLQAMQGEPLTVYGDGSQTRSLCYVEDEVRGLLALFDSRLTGPVNIGNPDEYTVLELARTIIDLLGSSSTIEHRPLPTDDPTRRRPDITVARAELGWEPTTSLEDGPVRRRPPTWPVTPASPRPGRPRGPTAGGGAERPPGRREPAGAGGDRRPVCPVVQNGPHPEPRGRTRSTGTWLRPQGTDTDGSAHDRPEAAGTRSACCR